ncbi:hypothetical protein INT45_000048 [Circinella minor]|uniref:EamA domain-containing protein n=1 Tax=Circinella minor TaxID=1195481 RepID=A0A8H7RXU7_9FUNG|nr:hypothetical protein INT45_000048 [Circinella minor]
MLDSNKINTENSINNEQTQLLKTSEQSTSTQQYDAITTGDISDTEGVAGGVTSLLPTSKREALGLLSISISTLGVASGATFVKLASKIFSTSQILVARFVFQGILSLIGCYCFGVHPLAQKGNGGRKWVFIRGFVGSLSSMTLYYSLRFLPLADATVIMNTHPVFAAIFGALILGEPFGWFERLCALICIIGATLVTKPTLLFESPSQPPLQLLLSTDSFFTTSSSNLMEDSVSIFNPRTIGIISAILASMTSAAAYVSVRIAGSRAHFLNHMLSLSVISIVLNSLNFQGFLMPHGAYQYEVLMAMAVTTFIGQCFLNRGLQMAPSGIGTLMCTNEVWLSFLFGAVVFEEYPDYLSVLGAILIMSVSVSLGYKKWNTKNNNNNNG